MTSLSVVIPTYNRGNVVLDTVEILLMQSRKATEIILIDQTDYEEGSHLVETLEGIDKKGHIRWIRLEQPSIPHAMNIGLLEAISENVLFLDDDVSFSSDFLIEHYRTIEKYGTHAHVGQILQPWQTVVDAVPRDTVGGLYADLGFAFNSNEIAEIENCMAGNLCVNRLLAIQAGGFDEQFEGVAFRFETEFCRRLIRLTKKPFLFNPLASLDHLKVEKGGTRHYSQNFLTSWSGTHSLGDYYFALREASGVERTKYVLKRLASSPLSRFYIRKPWWIPIRLVGELCGFIQALKRYRAGPKYLNAD